MPSQDRLLIFAVKAENIFFPFLNFCRLDNFVSTSNSIVLKMYFYYIFQQTNIFIWLLMNILTIWCKILETFLQILIIWNDFEKWMFLRKLLQFLRYFLDNFAKTATNYNYRKYC